MTDVQEAEMNRVNGDSESQLNRSEDTEPDEIHNFAVICRLLSEGAPLVMRDIFNHIHPAITLGDSLERPDTLKVLRRLKTHGLLSQHHWELLYPSNKKLARSKDYDVTLLGVLLKYVCHLTPPYPDGWEAWPVDNDTSLSADLARINCYRQLLATNYRNEDTEMKSVDFQKHFDDVCSIYKRLSPQTKLDVAHIQKQSLDARAQNHYAQVVVDWQHKAYGLSASDSEPRHGNRDTELTRSSTTGLGQRSLSSHPSSTSQSALLTSGTEGSLGRQLSRTVSKRSLRDIPSLSKEEMAKFERSILLKFQKKIVDTVHSDDVVGRLVQRSIFTHENKNKINLATKNSERMKIVIELLSKKAGKSFDIFCDTIKFKNKGLYDQLTQAKKAPFVQEKPDEVNVCCEALKSHYQTLYSEYAPIPWYKSARAPFEDCYVTPYITDYEGRDLGPENIFEGHSKCSTPKRLLITGQSGTGKSTMCRHLVNEWATGSDALMHKRFKLVFLLDLRRVTSDLVDSVAEQCLPLSYRRSQKELSDMLERHEKSILFILDGLDELGPNDTEVIPLIYKELYRHSNIVLTTNSSFANQSLAKYFDTKLTLMGLKRAQVEDLVEVYSRLVKVPVDSFSGLLSKVATEQDTSLSVVAQNPFYCLCMCLISDMGGSLDFNTQSRLLQRFMLALQRLYCLQNLVHMPEGRVPDVVPETVSKLQQFAFETLSEQKATFLTADIAAQHPKTNADLFSIIDSYQTGSGSRPVYTSHFCSRLLHEYLAACYLHDNDPEDSTEGPEKYTDMLLTERHMRQVAVFYCGLFKPDEDDISPLVKDFFTKVAGYNRKLWRGVTIRTGSGEDDLQGQRSEGRVSDFKLFFDCLEECEGRDEALEVTLSSLPTRLIMKRREVISGHTLRGMARLLESPECGITELDLMLDHFTSYEEYSVLKLARSIERSQQLSTLKLRWKDEQIFALLLAKVFGKNRSIDCIQVWDETKKAADNVSAMVWSSLRKACTNMQAVKSFAFMDCKNPAIVTSAVRNSPDTLEELCLTGCTLDLVGSQELGTKIEKSQSLHLLDLTGACFKRPDFFHIASSVRLTKSLQEFILADIQLDRGSMEALAEALIFNNSLRVLDLSCTSFTDASCHVIGQALATNKWLLQARFRDCDLSEEGVNILRSYKRNRLSLIGLAGRRHTSNRHLMFSRQSTDLSFQLSLASQEGSDILVLSN